MQMARFALINTSKRVEEWEGKHVISFGRFQVGCIFDKETSNGYSKLVAACTNLDEQLLLTEKNEISVPNDAREEAEQAIEHYANLLSVSNHLPRSLSSPTPSLAFKPKTFADQELLAKAKGIVIPGGNKAIPGCIYKFDLRKYLSHLDDRLDGVALLAEAISHKQSSGRFRDTVRFFERAFRTAGHKLEAPLAEFLSPNLLEYSKLEIENWIVIRNGITHADRHEKMLFESDVAWVVDRTVQAAYDIILNKKVWRSTDSERRNVWSPVNATVGVDYALSLTKGEDANFTFQVFDDYRRFPLNLEGFMTGIFDGWWTGPIRPSAQESQTS